jgi:hypothetical protein
MTTDPTPHLLFPTCADCNRIGLPPLPEMLVAMEKALGPDVLRAFLLAYGGREYATRRTAPDSYRDGPLGKADAWMQAEYSGINIHVPKGPAARTGRVAFTIWTRLCEGQSLRQIATETDSTMRTVCNRKKLFTDMGVLPTARLTNAANATLQISHQRET